MASESVRIEEHKVKIINWVIYQVALPLIVIGVSWVLEARVFNRQIAFSHSFGTGDMLIVDVLILLSVYADNTGALTFPRSKKSRPRGVVRFTAVNVCIFVVVVLSILYGIIKYDTIAEPGAASGIIAAKSAGYAFFSLCATGFSISVGGLTHLLGLKSGLGI